MGLLNKLGLKKEADKAAAPASPVAAAEKAEKTAEAKPRAPKPGARGGRAYRILLRPVLSEKGTALAGKGKYVFVVHPSANKSEIRKSIQAVYDVHVREVKILKMPAKARRYGRTLGYTSAFKKAIISLRAGEKIPGIIEAVG